MNDNDSTIALAIGRILSLASRPTQPGDIDEYYRCRSIILDTLGDKSYYSINYARDRLKGAQGD